MTGSSGVGRPIREHHLSWSQNGPQEESQQHSHQAAVSRVHRVVKVVARPGGLCLISACVARSHGLLQQGMMIIGRRTNFPFSDYVEHLDHENR